MKQKMVEHRLENIDRELDIARRSPKIVYAVRNGWWSNQMVLIRRWRNSAA